MAALRMLVLVVVAGLYATMTLATLFPSDGTPTVHAALSQPLSMSQRSVSTRSSSDSDADTVEYRPNFILSDHFYQCANPTLSTPADLAKALKDHLKFDLGIQNPYAYESTDNTLEAIAKAICPETEPEPVPSSSMWTWLKWVKPRVDPNLAFAQRAVNFFKTEFENNPGATLNSVELYGFMMQLWYVEMSRSKRQRSPVRVKVLGHALDAITKHFDSQILHIYDVTGGFIRLLREETLIPGIPQCIPKDDWPQTVQVFLEVHVAHNGLQLDASTRESLYSDLAAQSDLNDGELKSKFAKLMLSNELDHVQEHPSDVTKMLVAKFYGNN